MVMKQDGNPYGKTSEGVPEEQDDNEYLEFVRTHVSNAALTRDTNVLEKWKRSLKAIHNEHFDESKYRSKKFRGRSRLHKPKSRTILQKKLSDIMDAMFSTVDYVHVESESRHPLMRAGAMVIKNLLNIFLDKAGTRSGFNWFLTVMGAAQNAVVHGIVISKQYWKYEYQNIETVDDAGNVVETERVVTADHPIIEVIPPEDVIIDPAANWTDPVQNAMWISIGWPMHVEDVLSVCKRSVEGPGQWLSDITRNMLEQTGEYDYEAKDVRQERQANSTGHDRYENYYDKKSEMVWIRENFVRLDGKDMHFWTIGTQHLLSMPVATAKVYPEQHGKRPYHMGYGAIDAHTLFPMSVIESILPNQMELNDLTNLSLDAIKLSNLPIAKGKRGSRLDMRQIQNRTPESVILMDDPEKDLVFEKPPQADYSVYQQLSILNNETDDLAGAFNQSSVANNRQLNETATGMNLLSQSASKLSTYHVGVFIHTWVEPVLRQFVNLIQRYTDDRQLIALAGERAEIWKNYQMVTVTQEMIQAAVAVRVDFGNGSQDPMQRMQKLLQATTALTQILGPQFIAAFDIQEFVSVVMGAAGDRDGKRFINADILEHIQQTMLQQIGRDPEAEREQLRLQNNLEMKQIDQQTQLKKTQLENEAKIFIEKIKLAHERGKITLEERTKFIGLIEDLIKSKEKNDADAKKIEDKSDGKKPESKSKD